MNLLFTICARAGSKGLKNKNVLSFLEDPLPAYTLSAIDLFMREHTSEYNKITIAVNTDSLEMMEIIKRYDLPVLFIPRKEELAEDNTPKIDVIKDSLLQCESKEGIAFDIIVDLDLTSPLRTVNDINNAVVMLKQSPTADIVFSVTNSRRNPYFNMVREESGFYKRVIDSNFTSRQQAPHIFDMNASIYAYRAGFLKQTKPVGIFEAKALIVKMVDTAVLDIDNEEDYELMQILADYFYKKNDEMEAVKSHIKKLK